MNKKAQGSESGKALGIGPGELLASACSANAPLNDHTRYHTKAQGSWSGNVQIIELCRVDV